MKEVFDFDSWCCLLLHHPKQTEVETLVIWSHVSLVWLGMKDKVWVCAADDRSSLWSFKNKKSCLKSESSDSSKHRGKYQTFPASDTKRKLSTGKTDSKPEWKENNETLKMTDLRWRQIQVLSCQTNSNRFLSICKQICDLWPEKHFKDWNQGF